MLKLFGFMFGMGLVAAGFITIAVMTIYPKLPSMDELRNYKPKLPLQVYSQDNVLLGQFGDEKRIFMPIAQTPKMLINAILAAEDSRFYQHSGIDIRGIIRAAVGDVTSGKLQSGASTITMQVARNFFLTRQKTFSRKFYEVLLAYKMEQLLSKDQILEIYINQIYLGQRAYGFAEAAITYFAKPVDKLSIAQYAILAGLPKAPSAYNPIVNKPRAKERQMYVLERMLEANFITQQQYDNAINEPITTASGSLNELSNSGGYIAEMVRQMMFEKYGDSIYSQGYKVYTTIDSKMQQSAYNALRDGLLQYTLSRGYNGAEKHVDLPPQSGEELDSAVEEAFNSLTDYGTVKAAIVLSADNNKVNAILRDGTTITLSNDSIKTIKKFINRGDSAQISRGAVIRVISSNNNWNIVQLPEVEGAIVALNPTNGGIKAMMGGFDFFKNNYNHVTQAMRQPGSGFKSFIYSAALEKGFSANTIVSGDPICFDDGANGQWCPKNDEDDVTGAVSVREALARSLNIPTVRIISSITPQFVINHISHFGFDSSQFKPYLTIGLGANEVTPLQLAAAYAVFANGGYLVNPYIISTITDDSGKVLAKTAVPNISQESPTIDPRNAFIVNSMLQSAIRNGTGARAYRELKRNDLAGKTGTTNDSKDVWFNGYTPNLVAVTWVGFDQPKTLGAHAYGANIALPIWLNFMKPIINDIPQLQLPMPAGIKVISGAAWKGGDEYVYGESNVATEHNNVASAPEETNENEQQPAKEEHKFNNIESLINNLLN